MKPGRIVALVSGALGALIGVALLVAGATLIWAHATQRDSAGYYTTPTQRLSTPGYAITAQADFGARQKEQGWVPAHFLGTVRIEARTTTGVPVFVGIGPTADVNRWLSSVPYLHVTSFDYGPFQSFKTNTETVAGTRPPAPPSSQQFWVATAAGAGNQQLTWVSRSGDWTAVVMNLDASTGIAADVSAGAKTGLLLPVGIGVGAFALLVLTGSILLIVFGLRGRGDAGRPTGPSPTPAEDELVGAGR